MPVVDVPLRGARFGSLPSRQALRLAWVLVGLALLPCRPGWTQEGNVPSSATTLVVRFDGSEPPWYPISAEAGEVLEILADRPPGEVELALFEPGVERPCGPREDLESEATVEPVATGELRGQPRQQLLQTVIEWSGTYQLFVRLRDPHSQDPATLTFLPRRIASTREAMREQSAQAFRRGELLTRKESKLSASRIEFERSLSLARTADEPHRQAMASLGLGWAEPTWEAAIPNFETALALFTAAGDWGGVTLAHRNLGVAAANTGDLDRTDREYAAAIASATSLGDSALLSEIYWRWGRAQCKNFQRYPEAQEKLALARLFADTAGDTVNLFWVGFWTAKVDRHRFHLDSALDGFTAVLPLAPSLFARATTLNELGILYDQLGEYQRGRDFLIKAVATFELIHLEPNQAEEYANALTNLGSISQRLGDSPTMLKSYERARVFLPASASVAARSNLSRVLAWAYAQEGRWQEAIQAADEAIRVTVDVPDENAISRGFLGEVLLTQAANDLLAVASARKFLAPALGDYSALPNPQPAPLARQYEFLGEADRRLRNLPEAKASLEKALALNQQVGSLIDIALDYFFLARIERERGNLALAQDCVERALATYEALRARVGPPEAQASFASARPRDVQEFHIDLLMERHLLDPMAKFDRKALSASERARGQSLLDLVAQGRQAARDVPADLLLERETIRRALRGLDLQRSETLTGGKRWDESYTRWNNELMARESELQRIDERIRGLDPSYDALIRTEPVTVEQMQALLDDDTVLLEYLLGDQRSFLWVVTRDSVTTFTLSARVEIEAGARRFHDVLTRWGQAPPGVPLAQHRARLLAEFNRLAAELGNQLLGQPGVLLGRKRLAIVADGVLEYLPFGALLDPHHGTPVIENHAVSRLPSASVLAVQRQLREHQASRPSRQLAIFANPTYSSDSLPPLTYSQQEAERILSSATGPTLLKTGTAASRTAVLATNLAEYRYLHFAVHGKLDAEFPNFSKLVLSERDEVGRPIDGDLTLTDIYGLSLDADLVVLSACDTALGKNVRGEGLLGLTRGFLYAGADRVLSSLWQVQDEATTRLMERFYQALLQEGLSPGDALRAAQNEMRRIPQREFPYYWAGFVLQGEWR